MQVSTLRAVPNYLQLPESLFEKLLEKYPHGYLPQAENCYFILITPVFGKPYVLPDFVLNINLPVGWKTSNRKELRSLAGHSFAPYRGSKFKHWIQDRFLAQAECRVGFVAWLPNTDTDKPWLFKPGSSLVKNGGMPVFSYGDSIEDAMKDFL